MGAASAANQHLNVQRDWSGVHETNRIVTPIPQGIVPSFPPTELGPGILFTGTFGYNWRPTWGVISLCRRSGSIQYGTTARRNAASVMCTSDRSQVPHGALAVQPVVKETSGISAALLRDLQGGVKCREKRRVMVKAIQHILSGDP